MTALNYMIKQELYKGAPVNFSGTALKCNNSQLYSMLDIILQSY